jgi:hypothetical protein
MKHKIAYHREYIKGLNTTNATSLHVLAKAKNEVVSLMDNSNEYPSHLLKVIGLLGQLERFHAPKEIGKTLDESFEWCGAACSNSIEGWEQWVQCIGIAPSRIQVDSTTKELERFPEQSVMVGSDRHHRLHIEWGVGRLHGYKHCVTGRHMDEASFMDYSPIPPNFLLALCAGAAALDGYTIQTGNLLDSVDDEFKWFDESITKKWMRVLVYEIDNVVYVCVVNEKHLLDALSGFDDHHVTICENENSNPEKGIHHLIGTVRIDGTCNGKHRTAILKTARISDDTIHTLMGAI